MTDQIDNYSRVQFEKTLPSSWYTTDAVYAIEREQIFMREWVCVGREEQVPNTGDHKIVDVLGESVILLRNNARKLRAFFNVCRHRGAQLCAVGEQETSDDRLPLKGGVMGGNRIVCPYHAWTYDLDGKLKRAPHITDEMGLDLDKISLHSVRCQVWGGFVFLNLSEGDDSATATSFADLIQPSADRFKRYPLSDLKIAKTIDYKVNANWKVLCENYNECYHCGPVHPELCGLVPAFKQAGGSGLNWEEGIPHREGAYTFTASGTSDRRSFPELDEHEQINHKGDLIYPNLFLSLAADHVTAFVLKPEGPAQTTIECHFLFEEFEMEKPSFDASDAVEFWHMVNRQDWSICESVQQGMSARVHEYGVFSPMEDWNLDIRKYVIDRIGKFVDQGDNIS